MFAPVLTIARVPDLRRAGLMLILNGAVSASLMPYQSLIAIERLGLGARTYAGVMFASSVVFVLASVILGVLSDGVAGRRKVGLWSVTALMAGLAAMSLWPSPGIFLLTHGVLLPFGGALYVQGFALARAAADARPQAEREAILAAIRAGFALPWIMVLPLWSLFLSSGGDVVWVYPASLAAAALMAVLLWRAAPEPRPAVGTPAPSLTTALREMARADRLIRVLLVGPLSAIVALYMAIMGLAMTAAGRPDGDVALYAGGLAAIEIPFMLALPLILRRLGRMQTMAIGAGLYCVHLVGVPLLAPTPFVWLMLLPGAMGGAVILTLPIAYLQDLLADRPGAGSSLMSVQKVAGDAIAAACFAAGIAVAGHWLAALLGALVALAAVTALVLLEQREGRD